MSEGAGRAVLVAIDVQAVFEPGSRWGAPGFARPLIEITTVDEVLAARA